MKLRSIPAALVLLASTGAVHAAEPWLFPSQTSRSEAKCGNTAEADYQRAVELLREPKSDAKVDEAIMRLRCLVDYWKSSQSGTLPGTGGRLIPNYWPYLRLAEAFFFKGRTDRAYLEMARKCLDKEPREKLAKAAEDERIWKDLDGRISDRIASVDFLAAAETIEKWGGQGGLAPVPESLPLIAEVRRIKPLVMVGQERGATLEAAIRRVCETETSIRAKRLDDLRRGPLGGGIAADRCTTDLGSLPVAKSVEAVEKCAQVVDTALRRAGAAACGDLQKFAEDVARKETLWSTWTARETGAVAAPTRAGQLPADCLIVWDRDQIGRVEQSVRSLEQGLDRAKADLKKSQEDIVGKLEAKRAQYETALASLKGRYPRLAPDCTATLGLETLRTEADRIDKLVREGLPKEGVPSIEVVRVVAESGQPGHAVSGRVIEAVNLLLADRCLPADHEARTNLQHLAQSLDAEMRSNESGWCAPAINARRAIDTCYVAKIGDLEKAAVTSLRALDLTATKILPARGPASGDPGLQSCVADGLARIRSYQKAPAGAGRDWTSAARNSIDAAKACLERVETETTRLAGSAFAAHGAAMSEIPRVFEGLEKAEGPAPNDPWFTEARQALGRAESCGANFAGIRQFYPACDSVSGLVGSVRSLGTDTGPVQGLVTAFAESPKDLGPAESLVCAAARDALLLAPVLQCGRTVERVAAYVPRLALYASLESIAGGDVDRAVVLLRSTDRYGAGGRGGREREMLLTATAYALFLKFKALQLQDAAPEVRQSLEREALSAVQAATLADGRYRPNERVFPSVAFREWFGERAKP